jgi:hypothetical protein
MLVLRAVSPVVDPREATTEQGRRSASLERKNAFVNAQNALKLAVFGNEPFLPDGVFKACTAVIATAGREDAQLRVRGEDDPNWFDEAQTNAKEIQERVSAVATAIRQHLAKVVIVE